MSSQPQIHPEMFLDIETSYQMEIRLLVRPNLQVENGSGTGGLVLGDGLFLFLLQSKL